jgi:predicted dehydrogenase
MLRLGVVGTARILPAHLRGMKELLDRGLADFRVTALVGRTLEGALSFRRRGEGPEPRPPVMTGSDPLAAPHMYVSDVHPDTIPECYTSVQDMLEAGQVDAVLLLTPVYLHHTQALACLEAGVHVFCEKPLAVSVRAAWAMVREADRRGLVLGVAEGVRYDATARLQRWAVETGLLGQVEMMLVGGVGSYWSPDRIVAKTPWRHHKLEAGGGPSIDLGVHQFHHIRYVGGEVAEVAAMTACYAPERVTRDDGRVVERTRCDVEDTYHALFRLEGGGTGHVAFTWSGHGEPTFWPDGPVVYGTRGVAKGRRLIADDGTRLDLGEHAERVAPAALWERWFPAGIRDTKALQLLDFLRAVQARRSGRADAAPEASGAEGLRDLACAFAILESAAARRTVTVEEVLTGRVDAYQREIDEHYGLR